MMKESLANILKLLLISLFLLNFFGSAFISLINPESYFFGVRLGGMNASLYLLANGFVGVIIAYLLKKDVGIYLSVLYFGYNFTEVLITNLAFGFGPIISPFFTIGLVLSIALLMIREK